MTRPYPRYRDPGVDWMGGVPEHWDVCQARLAMRRSGARQMQRGEP